MSETTKVRVYVTLPFEIVIHETSDMPVSDEDAIVEALLRFPVIPSEVVRYDVVRRPPGAEDEQITTYWDVDFACQIWLDLLTELTPTFDLAKYVKSRFVGV